MLPVSAWLILLLACIILFGGLVLCLRVALRKRKVPMEVETSGEGDLGPDRQ